MGHMKPFNLAESRIAQRNYCQTHMNRRVRTIGMLVVLAVVVVGISYCGGLLLSKRAQKAKIELANIQKRCADIKRETNSAKSLLDQHEWQNQLASSSDSWLSVISNVLASLPDDVWVTRLETSPKDSTLQLTGRASSYDSLSAFVDCLHRDSSFSDIRLGTVRTVTIGEMSAVEFSVPMKLKIRATEGVSESTAQAVQPTDGRSGA